MTLSTLLIGTCTYICLWLIVIERETRNQQLNDYSAVLFEYIGITISDSVSVFLAYR